jgi:pimeloyl-ACP methyl ester carboxylesterase
MSLKDHRLDLPYRDDYLLPGGYVYLDEIQKLYCEQSGNGPSVIMIPGLGGDAAEFSALRALFVDEFSIVVFDRRGYSRSPRGWSKSSVDEQANDVSKLIRTLGLGAVFVFAASVGAAVALKLIMRFPAQIRGAILHEPWIPALLDDHQDLSKRLEAGELQVQTQRARYNTGPYEARLRYVMGASAFESLPADVRGRVSKSREMHTAENDYFAHWLPPSRTLFQAETLSRVVLTSGTGSHAFITAMTRRLQSELGLQTIEVPGMHAAYIDQAPAYHALTRPILKNWSVRPKEYP